MPVMHKASIQAQKFHDQTGFVERENADANNLPNPTASALGPR